MNAYVQRVVSSLWVIVAAACSPASAAEPYPARPIQLIIPFTPGGGVDLLGRMLAERLAQSLGQNVIVLNRPGAATLLGHQAVAGAEPDGYTIGIITSSVVALPAVNKDFTVDAVKDLTPISNLVQGTHALVVHPSVPAQTVTELIEYSKANPDKVNFAYTGGSQELSLLIFRQMAGAKFESVPYKGITQARMAVQANEVQVLLDNLGVAKEMADAGKVRILAVTSKERVPMLPAVPTVSESGVPGYTSDFWWGVAGPAGLPAPIVEKLNQGVVQALQDPVFATRSQDYGMMPVGDTSQHFGQTIQEDLAYWAGAARAAGISAN